LIIARGKGGFYLLALKISLFKGGDPDSGKVGEQNKKTFLPMKVETFF
jgi:hypothetical protein